MNKTDRRLAIAGFITTLTMASCSEAPDPGATGRTEPAIASESSQPTGAPPPTNLAGSAWLVETIDERDIIDQTMVTLAINDDHAVAGSTGCNRYFGSATTAAGSLTMSNVGSTRRACAEAIMNQEQRFLASLAATTRYAMESESGLVLLDADGQPRLGLLRVESDPTVADLPR